MTNWLNYLAAEVTNKCKTTRLVSYHADDLMYSVSSVGVGICPVILYKVSQIKLCHGPLARYVKFRVAHALGMPGTVPHYRLQWKPPVSDAGMHHGTCVTHVPWYMTGSPNRAGGENVPGIPGACNNTQFYVSGKRPMVCVLQIVDYTIPCIGYTVG